MRPLDVLLIFWTANAALGQRLPFNPCPELFRYVTGRNGDVIGEMQFENDGSGLFELSVNMSVAAYLNNNQNIRLQLVTPHSNLQNGQAALYNVYFPIQNVLPRPTNVIFNGRTYCSGPPEPLVPGGGGITNMWATTYLKTFVNSNFRPQAPPTRPPPIRPTPPPFTRPPTQIPDFGNNPFLNPRPTRPTSTTTTTTTRRPTTRSSTTTTTTSTTTTTTTTTTTPKSTGFSGVQIPCGVAYVKTQSLIFGGEPVKEGEHPWLGALMRRENFDYQFQCGVSIVSERHVITAAHCVRFHNAFLLPSHEDWLVVLGKNNIQNWASRSVLKDVRDIMVHPDYVYNKPDSDMAILILTSTISFQSNVRPVCLWQGDSDLSAIVGKNGTVLGWGRSESGQRATADSRKIKLPVVSQEDCLRSDQQFVALTSNRTFCAGSRNGNGPCSGDSGGGFYIERNGRWRLRGIVASSLRDGTSCDLNNYFIFADAGKATDWIKSVIN